MSLTSTAAWQALTAHREFLRKKDASFVDPTDTARLKNFDIAFNGMRLNYAFQNLTSETIQLLLALAEQRNLGDWRARMFAGDKINATENRAVLHTALRRSDDGPVLVDGVDVMPEIRATQNRIAAFVDDVRNGK